MFLYSLAAAMGLNGPGTTLLFVLLSVLFIKWFLKHKQPWKGRLPPVPSALPILGNLFQVDRRAPNKSLMKPWKGRFPPGPSALPILGNLFQVDRRAPQKSLIKLGEQYGPVFTIWLGSCPAVVLCGQEAVAEALIERGHDFSGRYVLPVFRKLANDYDTPLNPNRLLRCAASNIICSIVFGERFDYEDKMFLTLMEMIAENIQNLNSPWIQLYNSFPTILDFLPGPHKKQFQNAADLLNFIKQMIQSHKESLQKDFPRDYIDSFLIKMEEEEHKHDSEFIHMNLLWTIMNLFLAGTETTSTTLQSAIRILAKYPHIQEKIHSEIDEVVGSCRRPTVEDRVKMPYTDAVIHEVQRYIDLVPMSLPHTVTRDVEFRGYLIPKGTCVVPLLSSVLKATSQWETPEAFNPNHFLCENGHFKKSESFMAFSAGKRICPGESLARMELFLFLTTLLQSFVFNPVIDRKNIDISPVISGFSVVPNDYEFYAISR
ncbi:cytochrome P450 2C3-like isoform X5 [Scyliorhinus torazame]|uniref:cytochrome P450 2C3-like isoform X5 n=1 Tax=Scyliorhinus torazame TaxID=75743 RepID=UPI003B5BFDDD